MHVKFTEVSARAADKMARAKAHADMVAWLRNEAASWDSGCAWFVVRTLKPAHIVADAMQCDGIFVFSPTIKVLKRKPREQGFVETETALFERYLFVQCVNAPSAHTGLMSFDGVDCILGNARGPMAVSAHEIEKLQALATKPAARPSRVQMFIGGEDVLIARGPFADLAAKVKAPERRDGTVELIVAMFGKMHSCRMGIDDLKIQE